MCKILIILEIVVEVAGVELFSGVTIRKLLILHMARGKKVTIADSVVRLLYENLLILGFSVPKIFRPPLVIPFLSKSKARWSSNREFGYT
jgi:hypothetical protein